MCVIEKEDNSLYDRIIDYVVENVDDLTREQLTDRHVFPMPVYRYAIFDLLHNNGWSSMRIGRASGKNHATVMHGLRTIHDLVSVKNDKALFIVELLKGVKI